MKGEETLCVADKGEKAFAAICDKMDCEFLHIKQEPDEFSSKMWRTGQKRPDFLVNIPDITSLFVDVKARERRAAGEKSEILKGQRAFCVDNSDFQKMRAMENRIKISTWYAFFEMKDSSDIFESTAYLIPLSRVEKHIPDHIRKKIQNGNTDVKWEIRIPDRCLNTWRSRIDLGDQCQGCTEKYCQIFPK